jgi:hypothetical protein
MHPDPFTAFYISHKNSEFYGVTTAMDNFCGLPKGKREEMGKEGDTIAQ